MRANQIKYISFNDLDADKWDACIANSPNAVVYAQSWYLDKVCDSWDALVFGDYQYVLPLTFKTKMGISYLTQPLFCQQLGVFPTPTKEILYLFLKEAQTLFNFAEINLNAMNLPVDIDGTFTPRKNYLLALDKSYNELEKSYSNHTLRNLKKARKNKLNLIRGISAEEFLQFKKENLKTKIANNDFLRLRNILAFAITRSMGQIYGVYSNRNTLCAAVLFLRYKRRVTYLCAASNNEGRELNAMYYLLDEFIKENANSEFIIDFEGSVIPGIARFYEGFAATPETYHQLHWNTLPAWIKWLKR
ncbi:hypothetical protein ACUNWD_16020 [Sunxiuqinia sp. A32]|uniref:hypothetical protein n=1 Tax=Sunxiuqinia sp. A32 TaxID=3461496 RepID=UPI0040464602